MKICGLVPVMGKNFWGSECTGVTHYSSANQRFWRPGFEAGVYADEDNEEDIPHNAEMFEAGLILSAMQVLFFFTPFPCLCMSQTLFPFLFILYVCLSGWFCV